MQVRSDEDCTTHIKQICQTAAARHADAQIDFQLTGDVPMNLSIMSTRKANQLKYQLIGYGMILLLAVILFRGLSAVIITAAGPGAGSVLDAGRAALSRFTRQPVQRRGPADHDQPDRLYRRRTHDGPNPQAASAGPVTN